MVASERQRQWSRTEYPGRLVSNQASSETDSTPPLVGSAQPAAVRTSSAEDVGCGWATRVPTNCLQGRPPKSQPAKECPQNSSPSSPDRGGADLDGYSTVSAALSSRYHRRRRQNEKCLTPAHLYVLIFKSTDPNADVMYTLWRFDMQGWLDQYQEESMMLHIYASLQGY